MPKTKISEFSAIPGNNTDIDGINIAEGCPPSGINDAIRELMSQLKDFQAGTAGDSFNGPIGTTTPAAGVFTNLSASGTFALTGDQVQISEGGTGQTTANAAFNALAPSQSTHAGKYLKTDGTNTSWDALDISTADITGTLPTANGGTGLTSFTANRVFYASSTSAIGQSANLTFDGTTLTAANFADSSLTSGRVTYATTGGNLTDSANLLYSGTDLTVYGITVGRGAGAVSTNTAVGGSALAANTTGAYNNAFGYEALTSVTTGNYNAAFGGRALKFATTSDWNAGFGTLALYLNTTGANNTAAGSQALYNNTTASNNTAVGYQALYSNNTGYNHVAIGYQAGYSSGSVDGCIFIGQQAGYASTAKGNTIIGSPVDGSRYAAGRYLTSGTSNTALGAGALSGTPSAPLTGSGNIAIGYGSGANLTSGSSNTIIGGYSGNQGGLDIRTSSNYIVLSDGDGNPRVVVKNVGEGEMTVGSQLYTSPDGYEQISAVTTGGGNSAFLSAVATAGGQAGLRLRAGVGTTYRAARIDFFQTPVSNSVPRWTLINDYDQDNTNDFRLYSGNAAQAIQVWKGDATTRVWRTLGVGNADGSTSGAGITFPATQNASSNANTLDDYEEGTWTPAIRGSGTAGTYQLSTAEGAYVKIGQQVTLTCRVIFGTITGGGTGYMQITGAPSFNNAYVSAGAVWQNNLNMSAGYTWLTVSHVSSSGTTTLYFAESGDELTSNDFPISGVSSGDSFFFTITYITST